MSVEVGAALALKGDPGMPKANLALIAWALFILFLQFFPTFKFPEQSYAHMAQSIWVQLMSSQTKLVIP